jgi:hypothetical protein
VADDPWQIIALFTVIDGLAITVTVAVAVALQLPPDALIVYTVVDVGHAVTLEPVEALSEPDGLHVYVAAPETFKLAESPAQIVELFTDNMILLNTVTLVVSELIHPLASVPVTVYCVVTEGLAVTLDPVEELNEPAGLQV